MKTRLVRIGNSHGIRVPKVLVAQADPSGELELEVRRRQLIVRSRRRPREGWDDQLRQMTARHDDRLLWPESTPLSSFDTGDWEW